MNLWKTENPRLVILGSKDVDVDVDVDVDWDFGKFLNDIKNETISIDDILEDVSDKCTFGNIGHTTTDDDYDYENRVDDSILFSPNENN